MRHRSGSVGVALDADRLPDPGPVVDDWVDAVHGTSFVPLGRADLRTYLSGLCDRAAATLVSVWFDAASATDIGGDLVEAHFTDPLSLHRTITVLGAHFGAAAAGPDQQERVSALLGAVASGFASTLQRRTRIEQQQITRSAFLARTAAEDDRWDSEARYSAVFANSLSGIGVAGADGHILEANRALGEMFGYPPEAFVGRSVYDFVHDDDDPEVWRQVDAMLAGRLDHLRVMKSYTGLDGRQIWADLVLSTIRDQAGAPRYLVAIVEDVSDRHHLQTSLRHQAEHDALTGLPNRLAFLNHLERALAGSEVEVGVCYVDLDGFKRVNDTLGHQTGDHLLQRVAVRLSGLMTDRDGLVARLGGDEFVLVVHADPAEVRGVARDVVAAVREPFHIDGREIRISTSIGVVDGVEPGLDAVETLKAADTVLYRAKNTGRDRYELFDRHRHESDVTDLALAADLPVAIERGELVVDYQPLVDLRNGALAGVEALVRWRRPDGTRLGPDRFIPLAEQTGAIRELGASVLRQACRDAREWTSRTGVAGFVLSVNVSARQIGETDIVDTVARILADTGWPAENLQLELTESVLVPNLGSPAPALRELTDMGVRIVIDDFGTGYSNLAYLHKLPIHGLKLAGSFVDGTGRDNDVVVEAIIALAHTLDLEVTAESVETAEQAAWLAGAGCDVGQGWHFGRPGALARLDPCAFRPAAARTVDYFGGRPRA